jgi:hypothetical protein
MKRIILKESELVNLIQRVINEQEPQKLLPVGQNIMAMTSNDWTDLGGIQNTSRGPSEEVRFLGSDGKVWVISKEWIWQQLGVDDQPKWVAPTPDGISSEFKKEFDNRKEINDENIKAAQETGNFSRKGLHQNN